MLGEYKLNEIYNEDCYEAIKKIPDKSIDLIYVDIPYLYNQGGVGNSDLSKRLGRKKAVLEGIGKKYNEALKSGLSSSESLRIAKNISNTSIKLTNIENGIDYSILNELCKKMKYIYIYIWCSKLQILDLMKYFIEENKCLFEILTWNKTNPTPSTNNSYLPDIEYCLMFREPNTTKLNDGYELKSKWYVSGANVYDKSLYDHPTIKPLELVKRHILHSTQPGDIVADFFLGSGTTCVAAKELDRQYIGFEIDKQYYDIAKNRLNGINKNGQTSIFTEFEQMELL